MKITKEFVEEVMASLKQFDEQDKDASVYHILNIPGIQSLFKSDKELPELEELFISKTFPILENKKTLYEWNNAIECFSWFDKGDWRYKYKELRKPLYLKLQTLFQKMLSNMIAEKDIDGCRKLANEMGYKPVFFYGIKELDDLKVVINNLFIDELNKLGKSATYSSFKYFLDYADTECKWGRHINSFLNEKNKKIQEKLKTKYLEWLNEKIDLKKIITKK